jgi:hypothetical protein
VSSPPDGFNQDHEERDVMTVRMRMTSRSLGLGLALMVLLAACGGSAEQAEDGGDSTAGGETVEITAVDYEFEGVPETVETGTELTLSNESEGEVHEMVVVRIDDDETRPLEELLRIPEEEAQQVTSFAGVAVALPGEEGLTPEGPVVLDKPGRYAMLCFIPTGADPEAYEQALEEGAEEAPEIEGGPPHFTHGMAAELVVEE